MRAGGDARAPDRDRPGRTRRRTKGLAAHRLAIIDLTANKSVSHVPEHPSPMCPGGTSGDAIQTKATAAKAGVASSPTRPRNDGVTAGTGGARATVWLLTDSKSAHSRFRLGGTRL